MTSKPASLKSAGDHLCATVVAVEPRLRHDHAIRALHRAPSVGRRTWPAQIRASCRASTSTPTITIMAPGSTDHLSPRLCDRGELCLRPREPVADGLLGEGGELDPIRPELSPPSARLGICERPGRCSRPGDPRTRPGAPSQADTDRRPPRLRSPSSPGGRAPSTGRAAGRTEPRSWRRSPSHGPPARRLGRRTLRISVQRGDGICQVLEHLVRVDDVERSIGNLQAVDVPDHEAHVGDLRSERSSSAAIRRSPARGRRPTTLPGATRVARSECDGSGAASDVEELESRPELAEQVSGGVLSRAPRVASQHGLVMPVGVHIAPSHLPLGLRSPLRRLDPPQSASAIFDRAPLAGADGSSVTRRLASAACQPVALVIPGRRPVSSSRLLGR